MTGPIVALILYVFFGLAFTYAVGKADGELPIEAEVGIAGGILCGVFWPLAVLYLVAYSRSEKRSGTVSVQGRSHLNEEVK